MISESLQKAQDSLHIQDVYLHDLVAHCDDNFDPKSIAAESSLIVQTKHYVKQSVKLKSDADQHFLRVYVVIGARWVNKEDKDKDNDELVKAVVEAVFIAEYTMGELIEKKCIDEFALKNVSYHIWPYWRELLANQCDRMRLPRFILPTIQLADNRHTDSADDKSENEKIKG